MKALVTRLLPDKRREKVLVHDWVDAPAPGPGQFRTRTVYSGVTNGTERNDLIKGNYAHPDEVLPAPWGYQNVGRVIEVGEGVTKVKEGDLIYSSADHVEYVTIPEDWLYVRLPESVDPRQAALFGMASVAMRTCRNADIRMGERVLVVGAGFIGQIAAQIATVMGGRVTLCDINDRRLEVARRIGAAEEVVNVDGEEAWRNGIPEAAFPVVIDVAGVPGMENKLILAAGHRGRLVLIAGRFEVRYDFNVGQGREICIRQNSHFDTSDLENLCRLVERSLVQIEPMIQDVVPVEDAQGIYETLRDRPGELYGTVFEW